MAEGERPTDTPALLARLDGTSSTMARVISSGEINPYLQRVELQGDFPEDFVILPGQDVMLHFPTERNRQLRRRYSVRRFYADEGIVELNIARHGQGPGSRWAMEVSLGSSMEVIGPRGKVLLDAESYKHLFLGDLSSLAALSSLAEAVAADQVLEMALLVPGEARWPELSIADGVQATQRYLVSPDQTDASLLLAYFASLGSLSNTHIYLAAEVAVMRALRSVILASGFPEERLSAKSYWNVKKANKAHGEPPKDEA